MTTGRPVPCLDLSVNCCSLAARLSELVGEEIDGDGRASTLVHRFLHHRCYQRAFSLELLDIARAAQSWTWDVRRLAVLMLEHQILKLSEDDAVEFGFLLTKLGIKGANADGDVRHGMRKEGYSTTKLAGFIPEFIRRLERLNRVHLAFDKAEISEQALRDFIHASRRDCKSTLMRYVLTPDEVVDRIVGQLKTSTGVSDMRAYNLPDVRGEIEHCLERLPPFEADILRSLCRRSTIYWVSAATSQEINALVECPLNTVVAVVKPPGSGVEFELKRVGVKGGLPLRAVFSRDGVEVPPTHRIYGGSMAYYLRWEAGTAAGLAKIYRLIHQAEAPISRTLSVSTIYGIPVNGREEHVVEYFRKLQDAPEYEDPRLAMHRSIRAFRQESDVVTPAVGGDLGGDLGLATMFLGQVVPTQSILTGTTSFRLDRLAAYLSAEGPTLYFEQGLNTSFSRSQAKRFADELLEEVLGVVTLQDVVYENHAQYVDAILSVPANRARADRHYLSIMREIGTFWGTLLGMRSYSHGESFVARNVGLKSVWEGGEWRVKIVFMDHDTMYLTGRMCRDFHPLSAIPGMANDGVHIWGFRRTRGEVELLRTVFRIDPTVEREGHAALRDGLKAAYRKTHEAICHDPDVQGCFFREFVERLPDWDEIAVRYLTTKGDSSTRQAWREETTRLLKAKGYPMELLREYLTGIERHASFLEKYSFIY
ncbi:MAG: hypothetical protein ACRD1T_00020 [Acidimicrobiia bacterium]